MKNMLISGGTGGIGTAITLEFIRNGYHVFTTHNNKSSEALLEWKTVNQVSDENITFLNCDLTKLAQVESIIGDIAQEHSIDVLINNAGITDDSSFLKMKYEQWFNVLNLNLLSVFTFTQIVVKQMVLKRQGCIINISSINAHKGQFGQTNYCASKAGLLAFTKSLSLELATKGVRVNAICPGYTLTPMLDSVPSEVLDKIQNGISTGKLVDVQEIARTAVFISEELPSLTGSTISVNGGQYLH